jgi:hypothetical protein
MSSASFQLRSLGMKGLRDKFQSFSLPEIPSSLT